MRYALLTFLLLLCPITAFAETDDRFKQGSWEIAVGFDSTRGTLAPLVGYFLADNLEGIVHFDLFHADLSGDGASAQTDTVGGGIALYYNIPTGTLIVPFAGPDIVYLHSDVNGVTTNQLQAVLVGGVRVLVGRHGAVDLAGTVGLGVASVDSGGTTTTVDGLVSGIKLAYSVFF